MDFENLTPFAVQPFSGYDAKDQKYDVVVMRVGYKLAPDINLPARARLFSAQVMDRAPVELEMADRFYGEPNQSSLAAESDLSPYKPRCDVIVTGLSHAPGGYASKEWEARLRIGRFEAGTFPPEPEYPKGSAGRPVTHAQVKQWEQDCKMHRAACVRIKEAGKWRDLKLDKRIRVQGPRQFTEGVLGWSAGKPEAVKSVVLDWENAYGGNSKVSDAKGKELLNKAWFANPIGCGWLPSKWSSAMDKADQKLPKTLKAPQLTYLDDAIDVLEFSNLPEDVDTAKKMADFIHDKAKHRPANFGWLGKSWAPRLMKAGTYDQNWQDNRWPALPKDFNFGYWNGAPEDQQIAFPEPGFTIGLTHLMNPEKSGTNEVIVRMPGHRAFVLAKRGGLLFPFLMQIDTIVIDTEAMRIDLVWRTGILKKLEADKLEARFETDSQAPLLKFKADSKEETWRET